MHTHVKLEDRTPEAKMPRLVWLQAVLRLEAASWCGNCWDGSLTVYDALEQDFRDRAWLTVVMALYLSRQVMSVRMEPAHVRTCSV